MRKFQLKRKHTRCFHPLSGTDAGRAEGMGNLSGGGLLGGSLTVEAAMIMPILFMSLFLIFYLTAHVHNRCVLGCSAAEQAISGHEQEDPSYFALTELECSRSDTEKERKISFSAGTLYLNGEKLWSIEEEATYKKIRPLDMIRKIAAGKRLVKGNGKE